MTNWQMREEITFRCPDCGHTQKEMTPECSECRNKRTIPVEPGYSIYHVSFSMNGGQRKVRYQVLLTDKQAAVLSRLPDSEAYNLFWSLWDQVVSVGIDAGTDYEGMGCEIMEINDKGEIVSSL
jgi:predicted ATP-dependent serine protease